MDKPENICAECGEKQSRNGVYCPRYGERICASHCESCKNKENFTTLYRCTFGEIVGKWE